MHYLMRQIVEQHRIDVLRMLSDYYEHVLNKLSWKTDSMRCLNSSIAFCLGSISSTEIKERKYQAPHQNTEQNMNESLNTLLQHETNLQEYQI